MKRKRFEKHRNRATRFFEHWLTVLYLMWYEIEINYYDTETEFLKDNGRVVVARVVTDWQYMRAVISVNVPAVARLNDDELERAIVHELCHSLVNEMREADPDCKHEERVVTWLTKAFMLVAKEGKAK